MTSIQNDPALLKEIQTGYMHDPFTKKAMDPSLRSLGIQERNGLLFWKERLIIPRHNNLREVFFRLAHDSLGHFGFDKSYEALRHSYYWPNMRQELENAYIPACEDCQRNKSRTVKTPGPLHPLPIPDQRGDTIAIDFVGPLPEDQGFNGLATVTDTIGSDIRLIPIRMNVTAELFAQQFLDSWYCENGLPLHIISDRDKLFTSKFWTQLHKLTGIKLKMSSAYHPQTDGASERTNRTIIQALRYHVDRNQNGWARSLPRVRFDLMNTVNVSTGYSPFQLRMGRSPRIIPPLSTSLEPLPGTPLFDAKTLLDQMELDTSQAADSLLLAKVNQAIQADKRRGPDPQYKVGDFVMLNTHHRRREYMQKGDGRTAKFMPRWDGALQSHQSLT